eukprot:jgi/Mesvir1/28378/Mv06717-RA.1
MSGNDLFPSTIYCIESKIESPRNLYGRFLIEPLAIGQGITVGNTLRRILLGDIEGAAITSVKIPGANNEFSILPGIRESVLEILLNLKEIVFRTKSLDVQKGYLSIQGPCVVKAANLQLPTSIEVVDGGQYIATLSGTGRRKSAVARVRLVPGNGEVIINGLPGTNYLQFNGSYLSAVRSPLETLGLEDNYDIIVKAVGGGLTGAPITGIASGTPVTIFTAQYPTWSQGLTGYSLYTSFGNASSELRDPFEEHED